ncbi:MAG: hypothetical protein K2X45_19435 [Phreatobacter sp.]|nr:hypothetical protein [Phreatobacter sp.]
MPIRNRIDITSHRIDPETGRPVTRNAAYTIDDMPGDVSRQQIQLHHHAPLWVRTEQDFVDIAITKTPHGPLTPGLDEIAMTIGTTIHALALRLIDDGFSYPSEQPRWQLPAITEPAKAEELAADLMALAFGVDLYACHMRLSGIKDPEVMAATAAAAKLREERLAVATSPSLAINTEGLVLLFATGHATGSKQYLRDRVKNGSNAIINALSTDGRILLPGMADQLWKALISAGAESGGKRTQGTG